ncbi:hypothetical protein [Paenibacillus zanthoxyli]|uniref:hypothetical protein n=1 Tax=Paenibacillus zanthoxyli TaxID=369399 RepID=UPI0012EBAD3B|nr:hypothetical protein [Paenibacillus zanthoxyli]
MDGLSLTQTRAHPAAGLPGGNGGVPSCGVGANLPLLWKQTARNVQPDSPGTDTQVKVLNRVQLQYGCRTCERESIATPILTEHTLLVERDHFHAYETLVGSWAHARRSHGCNGAASEGTKAQEGLDFYN